MVSSLFYNIFSYWFLLAHPAFRSFKALSGPSYDAKYNLLKYWVVIALFYILETPSDFLLGWFPLYSIFKMGWIVALSMTSLSLTIYDDIVAPIFHVYESQIDFMIETGKKEGASMVFFRLKSSIPKVATTLLRLARLQKAETIIVGDETMKAAAEVIATVGDFALVRQANSNPSTPRAKTGDIEFPEDLNLKSQINPYEIINMPKIPRRRSSPLKRAFSTSEAENADSSSLSQSAAAEIRSKILFQVDSKPHKDLKKNKKSMSKDTKKEKKSKKRRSSLPEDLSNANDKKVKLSEVTNVIATSASSDQENSLSRSNSASSYGSPSMKVRSRSNAHMRDIPSGNLKGTPVKKSSSVKSRF